MNTDFKCIKEQVELLTLQLNVNNKEIYLLCKSNDEVEIYTGYYSTGDMKYQFTITVHESDNENQTKEQYIIDLVYNNYVNGNLFW